MARTNTLANFLKDIADTIRTVENSTGTIYPGTFDYRIEQAVNDADIILNNRVKSYNGDNFNYLFYNCTNITERELSKINLLLDVDNNGYDRVFTVTDYMFYLCRNITKIPKMTKSGAFKTLSANKMFCNCDKLTTIEDTIDLSLIKVNLYQTSEKLTDMFSYCLKLKNVKFAVNSIYTSISFKSSRELSDESIQSIIDGLCTVEKTQTITFNTEVVNKLTDAQKTIILNKNWIIG
nr:MAG TPA: hypothetical protein [Caudoviricetes sp.]